MKTTIMDIQATAPKPFVFVLMPFAATYDDIYKVGIKPACADAGAYCERVDEQHYDEGMLERIYNQIAKADFLVADMSGKNPNVFYEVGYAHALGKRVILLTQDAADIPFDLKHRPFIVYGTSISKLKAELEQRVRWFINNPNKPTISAGLAIKILAQDFGLSYRKVTGRLKDGKKEGMCPFLSFQITVYNNSGRTVQPAEFKMALIVNKPWTEFDYRAGREKYMQPALSSIHIADGEYMIPFPPCDTPLFPDERWQYYVKGSSHAEEQVPENLNFKIRFFTETGHNDTDFQLTSEKPAEM